MSRLRMASGMAAAFADAARGPASAMCGFVRIVVCGFVRIVVCRFVCIVVCGLLGALRVATKTVGRACRVILPVLLIAAGVASLSYLVYRCHSIVAASRIAAEATKHETTFNESLEAAVESADSFEINARVRVMVGSQLAEAGEAAPGSDRWCWFASLDGIPGEAMEYRALTAIIAPGPNALRDRDHTMRLMVMRSVDTGREYISVELSGEQAYLCVVEGGESLWPWVYRGIGQWEHLLDKAEAYVDRDRQQREIDSRFGNLEGEK